MSTVIVDSVSQPARWRTGARSVLASAAPRVAIAVVAVVVAYRTSLVTMYESLQLDTPIAHLSLVPAISMWLAWRNRDAPVGPDIHDRQLDWIVGLPLIVVATVMNQILPHELSWEFWVWRVDLLSLPAFVAGLVALLFGVRALWKYRLAIGFLLLAWPYPYNVMLTRWLGRLTDLTISCVSALMGWLPLATRVPNSSSQFEVLHDGEPIRMSIASACSGANGLVGFLLVGTALMLTVDGSRRRKWLWLAMGAVLVLFFNVVRILLIFWAAGRWGERVAIDGFHPVIGLVVFNIAIVLMLAAMRLFGLHLGGRSGDSDPHDAPRRTSRLHRPERPLGALLIVMAAVGVIGIANGNLRDYDRVASSLGSARLDSFHDSRESPRGWQLRFDREIDGYERFFGDDSNWSRYKYASIVNSSSEFRATVPITVDVIETPNRAAFSNYGVEQCYTFHGYQLDDTDSIDLGNGVTGGIVTWTNLKKELTWTSLYWHWPIKRDGETEYERITLIMQDVPTNLFQAPGMDTIDPADLDAIIVGSLDEEITQVRLGRQRDFMTAFAREMVSQRVDGAAEESPDDTPGS